MIATAVQPMVDHLSHSQIQGFADCPRRWWYRYVAQAPAERTPAALAFGSAVHDAVAAVNEAAMAGQSVAAAQVFARSWEQRRIDGPPLETGDDHPDDLAAKGVALVAIYQPPPGIVAVEQPVEVVLADDLPPVVGRLDLIRQDPAGRLVIADVKTAATKVISDAESLAMQLGIYDLAIAADQHEAIVLFKGKTPCQTSQGVPIWSRQRIVRHVREVYAAMTAGIHFACRGWACRSCPFRDRCRQDDP